MTLTQGQFKKEDFVARRRLARRQKNVQHLKIWWRYGILIGLVSASLWFAQSPLWELNRPEQIVIEGQRVLSSQMIRDLLSLDFPLRIFEVEPGQLRERLAQEPIILEAWVYRQLWPPQLAVTLQERTPVALAFQGTTPGVLDQDGVWLSLGRYPNLPRPALKVAGYAPSWQAWWQVSYPLLVASPVPIHGVDLTRPSNVILWTDLGAVHLGHPDAQRLEEQIVTLDHLRQLPTQIPLAEMAFIDLTSPSIPQVRQKPAPLKP